jgi:hypothetical protein
MLTHINEKLSVTCLEHLIPLIFYDPRADKRQLELYNADLPHSRAELRFDNSSMARFDSAWVFNLLNS